ncbi:acyl-CoA dehydrogenase family protein [Oceanicola sp. S124]|uniref:acyl-CoA dehydrogenase family protein n=1 Tax=Oceanicola sp. S124 TaxID=1042378 RepID=UPI00025588D4|nr:acyl-CoA dehydrogenase family protein [Oceanicola sp. S124]
MLDFSDDPEVFRANVSTWIETHCDPALRAIPQAEREICWGGRRFTFASQAQQDWMRAAAAIGMTAPRWPTDYGGAGLSRLQEKIYREELARLNAPTPLESFGLWMLGPALLAFGTHEQKRHYLPQITRGEIRWCQGYSEPGAGSDLASVQTRAEDRGDHWLVNGSKIWTSYADQADWIFALVRTDREAPKHRGISFMLIDMEAEGVTTRPIRLISGASPFCETFFENVVVPKEDPVGLSRIVGELNRGWDVAKHLLTHEREMIGGGAQGLLGARSLGAFLADLDPEVLEDPVLKTRAMALEVDSLATAMTLERYRDMAKQGGVGHASAMLKYAGTELNKRRYELLMSVTGSDGLDWDGAHGSLPSEWLRTKANSIEGGTSEVMLDILAKRVLDLPSQ